MADLSAKAGFQACSRNACSEEAVITLSCNYMARRVTLVELTPTFEPDHFHLCQEHLGRFRPPLGWEMEDLRAPEADHSERERATA